MAHLSLTSTCRFSSLGLRRRAIGPAPATYSERQTGSGNAMMALSQPRATVPSTRPPRRRALARSGAERCPRLDSSKRGVRPTGDVAGVGDSLPVAFLPISPCSPVTAAERRGRYPQGERSALTTGLRGRRAHPPGRLPWEGPQRHGRGLAAEGGRGPPTCAQDDG
jgi:hypothetical protein